MQLSFQEGLPFLQNFVNNARLQGAKEYKKIKIADHYESDLKF